MESRDVFIVLGLLIFMYIFGGYVGGLYATNVLVNSAIENGAGRYNPQTSEFEFIPQYCED